MIPCAATAPTLSLTTKLIVAGAERVIVNVTCTTSQPDIGTAWLVNDESGNSSEVVYSVSNTYRFYITLADFGDMDRLAYQCVAYDPDRSERVIISSVTIWFNRLFGKYTQCEQYCNTIQPLITVLNHCMAISK